MHADTIQAFRSKSYLSGSAVPSHRSAPLIRWLAPTCALLWCCHWQKVICPSPAVKFKRNQLRVSHRGKREHTHTQHTHTLIMRGNVLCQQLRGASGEPECFPSSASSTPLSLLFLHLCHITATVHIISALAWLTHTHFKQSFMFSDYPPPCPLLTITVLTSPSSPFHFAFITPPIIDGEHWKPVCRDSSVTVSVFTELLGGAGGKGKCVCARGVIINTHPFQQREHVLSFDPDTQIQHMVPFALQSVTLFLIYLFHNTLQALLVPQAVEQQGRCFAALGERPRTEGQRS